MFKEWRSSMKARFGEETFKSLERPNYSSEEAISNLQARISFYTGEDPRTIQEA
jgi:hypothetical protein